VKHLNRIAKRDLDRVELERRAVIAPAWSRDEEVEQHRLTPVEDDHVAAGAKPRQQRLSYERREHAGNSRINRVAPAAQGGGSRLRGELVARSYDPALNICPVRTRASARSTAAHALRGRFHTHSG
jgi:hypothetical protein